MPSGRPHGPETAVVKNRARRHCVESLEYPKKTLAMKIPSVLGQGHAISSSTISKIGSDMLLHPDDQVTCDQSCPTGAGSSRSPQVTSLGTIEG